MAQKDKVKELVGRSLDSYHTKALQQMDRIEKKNKEQNHKLSILTNELDNDYLTKTEEGSVVSLEHSKEGMVYLDELQGNTLVNYCTDGAKELTLNGDIDVEGTSVTLTEGVDNGLVDVMCEGNTLINHTMYSGTTASFITFNDNCATFTNPTGASNISFELNAMKPSTIYTVIFNVLSMFSNEGVLAYDLYPDTYEELGRVNTTGLVKKRFTTPDDISTLSSFRYYVSNAREGICKVSAPLLLEGDWTDKEIPNHFEGMKSVGQDDENGHKIEILSRNDNLFVPTQHIPNGWSFGNMIVSDSYRSYWIECKPNTTYFIESDKSGNRFGVCCSDVIKFGGVQFAITKGEIYGSSDDTNKIVSTIFTTDNTAKYLFVYTTNNGKFPTPKIMISESSSEKTYIEPRLNKKEILINEPLRAIDNIKDRFVKIGGKWFIERNCGEMKNLTLYDIKQTYASVNNSQVPTDIVLFNLKNDCKTNVMGSILANKGVYYQGYIGISKGQYYLTIDGHLWIAWNLTDTIDNAKTNFINNNQDLIIIYPLATPTYEPIEDVELITYLDTTHISNNSLIPCNMKVKNSGYNAIIKPSTLYTIALDTNKSGTIGMNLGGAKGTITNNVLTLTTPATLSDDSLRLYGKGIKGSKVRLLEGDKTNYIPSFFEGMKSSFEDKVQEDGSYKMEILSNNKNLIKNGEKYKNWDGYTPYQKLENGFVLEYSVGRIAQNTVSLSSLKHGETYTFSCDVELLTPLKRTLQVYRFGDTKNEYGTHINTSRKLVYTFKHDSLMPNIGVYFQGDEYTTAKANITNIQLEKKSTNTECIDRKYNKIQFSSIEPLRAVGDVKDRFIFKDDGKLMIERNIKNIVFDGSQSGYYYARWYTNDSLVRVGILTNTSAVPKNKYNVAPISPQYLGYRWYTGIKHESIHIGGSNDIHFVLDSNRFKTKDLNGAKEFLSKNPIDVCYVLDEPYYEEIPFELQKIILEGYENGILFFDTNIPPTSTVTYAGETPIVKSVRLNKTEVLNNTTDINDNIVPYLMDMDYRVVCLQLEGGIENISVARLFGGTFEMLQRDILSNRYSKEEYKYRLDAYLSANKITEDEYNKLGDMLND